MAVMSDAKRAEGWSELMDELSSLDVRVGTSKTNLRAAYDALDAWLNDNAATINAAIPQPARSDMPTAAKAVLLKHVITQRYLEGV